ncbi:4'-phosphopantetheinyl transferase family protein [Aquimarina muelleri]|uniref:4'-phosphopantetheinyl transferase n=1 Tax=Aquimarina muelleri TaxID=279356 RepID=A0A918N466_9FLAO|nr:4'-phosphopantetheinyl transferase superfamily protein [Aquimarina muelleri]MCX2764472.1 4'-phosphopantetheinyl transferase superfamily protein [Aquimarina muelleri]GGX32858.1 4'-phosphopantetheinyl transferase [Aquimarina muelleri]
MQPINIFFTSFKKPLDQEVFSDYLSLLPVELREKNLRYIRWQNRHAHLFGRLLLMEALKIYGVEKDIWEHIAYTSYHRPYLTLNGYDFNISHSGDFVICAIGKNVRLGIDIEENRDVDFKRFWNIMTPDQWDEINRSSCSLKMFYKYWTIKESVIKADGRGFYIPLDKLEVKNNTVQLEEKLWFVNELEFTSGYSVALTTSKLSTFKMHEVNFYKSHLV